MRRLATGSAALTRLVRAFWILALAGLVACAPPEPLAPDCNCSGADGVACSPADVTEGNDGTGTDTIGDLPTVDEVTPDGTGEVDVPVDLGTPCPEEHPCIVTGVCAAVEPRCVEGEWLCDYSTIATFEMGGEVSCDNLDNDCDGKVDEDLVPPEMCKSEGVCAEAVPQCNGAQGTWDCGTSALDDYEPMEVSYDGLDNDCDGQVDEGMGTECEPGDRRCVDGSLTEFQECAADGNSWSAATSCGAEQECMGLGVCTRAEAWMVNEYDLSGQTGTAVSVSGANLAVAWQSLGQDSDDQGIYFKLFDEAGDEVLGERQANLFTTGAQQQPAAAPLGDGAFFLGWESNGQDGNGLGLFGRLFLADGSAASEVGLTSDLLGGQVSLALAGLADGSVATVWSDEGDGGKLKAGLVTAQGWPTDANVTLTSPGGAKDASAAVIETSPGTLLVVYERVAGIQRDVYARYVESVGAEWTLQAETTVAASEEAWETVPQLAMSGDWVFVGWLEQETSTAACVQRFSKALVPDGAKKCLNSNTGDIIALKMASLGGGEVALAWQEMTPGEHYIMLNRLSADLTFEDEQMIDSGQMDVAGAVDIVAFPGGKVLVTWAVEGIASGLDVWARFVQM